MQLKPITIQELRKIYAPRLKRDFPPDELMPLSRMEELTRAGSQSAWGFYEGDELAAYAVFITNSGGRPAALLNYFAVEQSRRGRGVGTQCLRLLKAAAAQMRLDCIIFEVEKPEKAESPEDLTQRRRRIQFYLAGGALATGVDSRLYGVDYHIMVLPADGKPATPPDDRELAEALTALYRTAVADPPAPGRTFEDVCQVYYSKHT